MNMEDIEKEFLGDELPKEKIRPKKQSINSKRKGNTGESECVKILKERFPNEIFSRTMGSGNYTGGKNVKNAATLTEEQLLMFTGDIRAPKNFVFAIEHKFYAKIDFYDLFNKKSKLYEWYEQSESDARLLKKEPLLIVKTNNHKRIVFVPMDYLVKHLLTDTNKVIFIHGNKACMWFEDLLKEPDTFFFK